MSKSFNGVTVLDSASLAVGAGELHVLLGENGAGKSTLVKCIMGALRPDGGQISVDGIPVEIRSPKDALRHGFGMVYQHFTLIPALTGVQNLVLSRAPIPAFIDWEAELKALTRFVRETGLDVPLDRPVSALAAGEKQKLEILKQLYLRRRLLILDEPTSVLTPNEADSVLGMIRALTRAGRLTALMITHKFREVEQFADGVTVLRGGRVTGSGAASRLSITELSKMMIGNTVTAGHPTRHSAALGPVKLEFAGICANNDLGHSCLEGFNLKVRAGEIVGVAGISGNGQRELVEVASGQRRPTDGAILVSGKPYEATRAQNDRFKVFSLPEEPSRNAVVPRMSVAENIALRTFDKPPTASLRWWYSPKKMRERALCLAARYSVVAPSIDTAIEKLSGGNIQRAVLARELSGDVEVLIVANPCFGLDFVTVADIRAKLMGQRNRGAAVLLITEDLDEIMLLADRVAVMFGGAIVHSAAVEKVDRLSIGLYMGGYEHGPVRTENSQVSLNDAPAST
jgi:simple sugar transport system ATP-binding protein